MTVLQGHVLGEKQKPSRDPKVNGTWTDGKPSGNIFHRCYDRLSCSGCLNYVIPEFLVKILGPALILLAYTLYTWRRNSPGGGRRISKN